MTQILTIKIENPGQDKNVDMELNEDGSVTLYSSDGPKTVPSGPAADDIRLKVFDLLASCAKAVIDTGEVLHANH